jgi:transposase
MFYVGIDIAKRNHEVAAISESAQVMLAPFSFANSKQGCEKLLVALTQAGITKENSVVAMEATGHYWFAVYFFLADSGFNVTVFNPIQTDAFRDLSIRKVKNDSVDSIVIAQLLRFGQFSPCNVPNENIIALKNLSRFHFSLVDLCSDLKRKVICLLDQVFPEYETLFSDVFGVTSKQLLLSFNTPEDFVEISTTKLANFLHKASRGRLGREKALSIKSAAVHSIGISFALNSFSFQIKQLVEQIDFTEKQIAALDKEISKLLSATDCAVITTITGISSVLGAAIVGEIGDIARFESAPKLVAYAGLDASVKQSGDFTGTKNKISKRGSPYLRRALWLAAFVASRHDPVLSLYYSNLIARGKSPKLALTAVSRKLCNIVWKVLSSKIPYSPKA